MIETTLPTQDYGWLTGSPAMREFVDERVVKALSEKSYSITDKTWEATLGISRRALEDDQYGALRIRVNDLANEAARHQHKIETSHPSRPYAQKAATNFAGSDCFKRANAWLEKHDSPGIIWCP